MAAVLARRALQIALGLKGYKGKELTHQIVETEKDPSVSTSMLESLQVLRQVGNYGAHPNRDASDTQLEVEPGELELLFMALDEALDFFFVKPARRAARIAEVDAKLKSAGKEPIAALVAKRASPPKT